LFELENLAVVTVKTVGRLGETEVSLNGQSNVLGHKKALSWSFRLTSASPKWLTLSSAIVKNYITLGEGDKNSK
jgi:hypothetical protein